LWNLVCDPATLLVAWSGEIPGGVTVVSESGIAGAEQLNDLEEAGVDGVLVGESLMRSADPEAALRKLRGDRTDAARIGARIAGKDIMP
jgi:indole-3-glycerol phosphate synthase